MYCSNCGQQLPDAAAFCSKCGTRVQTSAVSKPQALKPEKRPGHWVYKDVTLHFEEPFTYRADLDGMLALENDIENALSDAKGAAWELAEEVKIAELISQNRVLKTVITEGLLKKTQYWTVEGVTLKFRQWVE